MVRNINQDTADAERVYYSLNFPADFEEKGAQSFLRAISTALKKGGGLFSTVDTLVFETWSTDRGFTHVVGMNKNAANYVVSQMRTHIPGLRAEPYERDASKLSYAVEVGMTNPQRLLHIPDGKALSQSLLASVQALRPNEAVVTQWIVTPAKIETLKHDITGEVLKEKIYTMEGWGKALAMGVTGAGAYKPVASNDEVRERTAKLSEPNMQVIGRVASSSPSVERLGMLVGPVVTALRSAKSTTTTFKELGSMFRDVPALARSAATPGSFPAQLNVIELSAVMGWPIGHPHVAGLPQGGSRHLPATESIPREGRVIGVSNFPGNERRVAISRSQSLKHLHVMGPTGVGKTTLLENLAFQDMNDGYGVIVMESKGDLFNGVLNLVPSHRIGDVVVLDVNERNKPVGFNVLDQGSRRGVIDQLTALFQMLYNGSGQDIWFRELLYFGLSTLIEREGSAFTDLAPLISPTTPEEEAWSNELKASVTDKDVREFWSLRWHKMEAKERQRYAAPLHNRIWQLASRPELRNIVGQSTSSFQMEDILKQNKILLINLAGVPREAASLAGTLIMNAVWSAAQRVRAEKPNYLFLDEFQDFIRLPVGAEDMLAKARGFNLSMTLAHQHLAQLPEDVKAAVISNARSKLYFQTSPEDARVVLRSLATSDLNETDLIHLGTYEAYARVAVEAGSSSPVSLMTNKPAHPEGYRDVIRAGSSSIYGRSIADIEAQMVERRKGTKLASASRPPIGFRPAEWGK